MALGRRARLGQPTAPLPCCCCPAPAAEQRAACQASQPPPSHGSRQAHRSMVAASSSTNTATGWAPAWRAALPTARAVAGVMLRLARGHRIMPIRLAPAGGSGEAAWGRSGGRRAPTAVRVPQLAHKQANGGLPLLRTCLRRSRRILSVGHAADLDHWPLRRQGQLGGGPRGGGAASGGSWAAAAAGGPGALLEQRRMHQLAGRRPARGGGGREKGSPPCRCAKQAAGIAITLCAASTIFCRARLQAGRGGWAGRALCKLPLEVSWIAGERGSPISRVLEPDWDA